MGTLGPFGTGINSISFFDHKDQLGPIDKHVETKHPSEELRGVEFFWGICFWASLSCLVRFLGFPREASIPAGILKTVCFRGLLMGIPPVPLPWEPNDLKLT